jgi:hypothetical protein
MKNFQFETNEKSELFCGDIARAMVRLFHIPLEEAIGRINAHWKNQPMVDDEDIAYHETDEFWANQIYFEDEPRWWTVSDPKPRQYP